MRQYIWLDLVRVEIRYTMFQRIQQSNYDLGKAYHQCGSVYHPATDLYFHMCVLREMNRS